MIANSLTKSNQRTLASDIIFSGIGLHSGEKANVTITSDVPNSGITFIRSDLNEKNVIKRFETLSGGLSSKLTEGGQFCGYS